MEGINNPGQKIENREWEKFLPLDKYWTPFWEFLDSVTKQ